MWFEVVLLLFEVSTGRSYSGKFAEFGEPVLAYCYLQPGPKGRSTMVESCVFDKEPDE